ncbi:Rieske (2Fe-2S) protein [Streptomyces sp. NPDC045431]|uniref:Rieske (2Fe-2S) protein n=1 Tax=Streptomyces sp. NPDC045431 TaxID=3155613 RepID=UPI0033E02DBE
MNAANAASTPRRTVLAASAAATAALVTACGGGGDGEGPTDGGSPAGEELARAADIPVGGGRIFADRQVVVTQPSEGEFRAFSAICTHQRCTVGSVANGVIRCPCHGSTFRVEDASVVTGPATRPLPAREISVSEGAIRLG